MIDILSIAKDVLLDMPYVSNTIIQKNISCGKEKIPIGLSCNLLIKEKTVPMYIGIPESWERDLVSIYLADYFSLPFMPHVEPDGKICLFDLEGVLIDLNFEGLFAQCIRRAKEIIEKGLYCNNDYEFVREFTSYWEYLKHIRVMKFAVPSDHTTKVIKYNDTSNSIRRKKEEKFQSFQSRLRDAWIYGAADSKYFDIWNNVRSALINGAYIHIKSNKFILPPDFRKELVLDYINNLLGMVPKRDIQKISFKIRNSWLMVFEIEEPCDVTVCFGVLCKNVKLHLDNNEILLVPVGNNTKIIPLSITRSDEEFLRLRTIQEKEFDDKKCLLVGCGSLGGYLCLELLKAGWNSIDLIDSDTLKEENIYRHVLGMEYVGNYKAEGLVQYCKRNYPPTNISACDDKLENLIEDGSIDVTQYDVIISATGNHNVNRWLNRLMHIQNIGVPCIYMWNEPLDIGCHIAVIRADRPGCYECFFDRRPDNHELYDATAYVEPGQIITRNYRGCSGSFVPYASNVSLKTVSLCMEWLDRVITGRCENNVLVSYKGDAYYFRKAGFKCSDVYRNQNTYVSTVSGQEFRSENCSICRTR